MIKCDMRKNTKSVKSHLDWGDEKTPSNSGITLFIFDFFARIFFEKTFVLALFQCIKTSALYQNTGRLRVFDSSDVCLSCFFRPENPPSAASHDVGEARSDSGALSS